MNRSSRPRIPTWCGLLVAWALGFRQGRWATCTQVPVPAAATSVPAPAQPPPSFARRFAPPLAQLALAIAAATVSWHLWHINFTHAQANGSSTAADIMLVRYPTAPRHVVAQFKFSVQPPRSSVPSRLELGVGERPAVDPAERLRERPATAPLVTLVISDAFQRALKHCTVSETRTQTNGRSISTQVPVKPGAVGDAAGARELISDSFNFDLGDGQNAFHEDGLKRWLRIHGSLHQLTIPSEVFDDGSASADLRCDIASSYLWAKQTPYWVLRAPRLVLSAPATAVTRKSPLTAINWTAVATNDAFYYESGRNKAALFAHTAEFNDASENGTGNGHRQSAVTWEYDAVFSDNASKSDRDAAIVLLGVMLAAMIQFLVAAVSDLWSRMLD
jgi:hypothetical protein